MKHESIGLLVSLLIVLIVGFYSTVKTNRRIDNLFDRVADLERTAEIMVENCDSELVETMDALAQEQRELGNLVSNNIIMRVEEGSDGEPRMIMVDDVVRELRGELGAMDIRMIGLEMAQEEESE